MWAASCGTANDDQAFGCAADINGNILVTGGYLDASISFGSTTLINEGNSDVFVTKIGTTAVGIEESSNSSKTEVVFFPNPSSGVFSLQSSQTISSIEILNVIGEMIYSEEINTNKKEIDLSDQSNGIYFIRIQTENEIITRKLCISK